MLEAGGRNYDLVHMKWADHYDFTKEDKSCLVRNQAYIIFSNYDLLTNKNLCVGFYVMILFLYLRHISSIQTEF